MGVATAAVAVRSRLGARLRPPQARRGRHVLSLAGAAPRDRPTTHRVVAGDRDRRRVRHLPALSGAHRPTPHRVPPSRSDGAGDLVVRPDPPRHHAAHGDDRASGHARRARRARVQRATRVDRAARGDRRDGVVRHHRRGTHQPTLGGRRHRRGGAHTLAGDRDPVRDVCRGRHARAAGAADRPAPRQRQQLGVPRQPDGGVSGHPERPTGPRRPHGGRRRRARRGVDRCGDRRTPPSHARHPAPAARRARAHWRSAPICAVSTATGSR